jgi:ankyrin repeat protein
MFAFYNKIQNALNGDLVLDDMQQHDLDSYYDSFIDCDKNNSNVDRDQVEAGFAGILAFYKVLYLIPNGRTVKVNTIDGYTIRVRKDNNSFTVL